MRKFELLPHRNAWGWIFSIQAIAAIAVSIIYPLIFAGVFSFTDLKYSNLNSVNFVGFKNYEWIFTASDFFKDLGFSVLFAVTSTLIQTVIGFLFAFLLYNLKGKVQTFFKVILYIPVILPTAIVSFMFIIFFAGDSMGILNNLLGWLNPPFQWLSNPNIAFWAIIFINTWRFYGITMVIYLVNMEGVSKEVVEAATIEGCNKFQIMMKIIIPLVASATVLNVILSMIGGIQSFDLFYLFQQNSNLSNAITPVGLYIFRLGLGASSVKSIQLARSMAMSILLTIIIAAVTIALKKIGSKLGGD